jgi:predicted hotdog family 3-hydroxylacyl-ACP dehydratase
MNGPLPAGPVAALVPHAGPMCLLGQVTEWSVDAIRCTATVAARHPLKIGGRLPATALIEYAAQAMAAHGRLLARDGGAGAGVRPRPGMLAGLRSVELSCRWVEARDLVIVVDRVGGDDLNVLYRFRVADVAGTALASGRAMVVLDRTQGVRR